MSAYVLLDPVLLCNDLGPKRDASSGGDNHSHTVVASSGRHSMSIKEAVRIARSNNFMGLICSSRLFVSFNPLSSGFSLLPT